MLVPSGVNSTGDTEICVGKNEKPCKWIPQIGAMHEISCVYSSNYPDIVDAKVGGPFNTEAECCAKICSKSSIEGHDDVKKDNRLSAGLDNSTITDDSYKSKMMPWTLPRTNVGPIYCNQSSAEEFMTKYIAVKHSANIILPWEEAWRYKGLPIALPLPIISVNFPKSATTTLMKYFKCGGVTTSVHTSSIHGRLALCMRKNHLSNHPPLEGCDSMHVLVEKRKVVKESMVENKKLIPPVRRYVRIYFAIFIAKHIRNIANYFWRVAKNCDQNFR